MTYHELLLDPAEPLDAGSQLKVVVRRGFGDGGDDGNPVSLGADVVGGRDAGDVDVFFMSWRSVSCKPNREKRN